MIGPIASRWEKENQAKSKQNRVTRQLLTFAQKTKFRLVQIERLCKRQL